MIVPRRVGIRDFPRGQGRVEPDFRARLEADDRVERVLQRRIAAGQDVETRAPAARPAAHHRRTASLAKRSPFPACKPHSPPPRPSSAPARPDSGQDSFIRSSSGAHRGQSRYLAPFRQRSISFTLWPTCVKYCASATSADDFTRPARSNGAQPLHELIHFRQFLPALLRRGKFHAHRRSRQHGGGAQEKTGHGGQNPDRRKGRSFIAERKIRK